MKPLRQLTVVPTLPANLEPLRELALNLWWTWDREALDLFHHLDAELWEKTYHNPVAMLGQISQERLDATSKNSVFLPGLRLSTRSLENTITPHHGLRQITKMTRSAT